MSQPDNESLEMAMKALSAGEYDKGERIFTKLIVSGSNMPESFYGLGLVRLHFGQAEAATKHFEGCLKLNPGHANALYYLGTIAETNGEREVAKTYFLKCLEINPQHVGAAKKLGSAPASSSSANFPQGQAPTSTPAQEKPRAKTPHSSDFYGLLRSSEEPVEEEIASHLDSIAAIMSSRTQRAIGLLSGFVIFLIALDGGAFAAFAVAPNSMKPALLAALALLSLLSFLALFFRFLNARTTRITCDRDWLLVSSGIFHKSVSSLHLFIMSRGDVSTDQNFINRLTGDGKLTLGAFTLTGYFTPNELVSLASHFRLLSMLNPVGRQILAAIGELKQIRSGTN